MGGQGTPHGRRATDVAGRAVRGLIGSRCHSLHNGRASARLFGHAAAVAGAWPYRRGRRIVDSQDQGVARRSPTPCRGHRPFPAGRRGPAVMGSHRAMDSFTTLGHRLDPAAGVLQLAGPGSSGVGWGTSLTSRRFVTPEGAQATSRCVRSWPNVLRVCRHGTAIDRNLPGRHHCLRSRGQRRLCSSERRSYARARCWHDPADAKHIAGASDEDSWAPDRS